MTSKDTLPQELLVVLDTPEFDDEADIVIDAVTFTEENLVVRFSFRYYYNETPPQLWQLTVIGVVKEQIVRDWTQHIALYNQHPLLLDHTDTYRELYFKGTTYEYKDLFIEIYEALLPYKQFINESNGYPITPEHIKKLSQQGYGLFARGSQTILKLYQQCLLKYGIHAYFVGEIKPNAEKMDLKLFELGGSYVIGKTFDFVKIE